MDSKKFENRFLDEVKDHQINILRDNGVDRHLRFRKPGTIIYGFDILTWSGHLCVTGDCGTFVFRRLEDMFDFFRMPPGDFNCKPDRKLHINAGYWHEKVLAEERQGGCKKYSEEIFREEIKRWFDDWAEDQPRGLVSEIWAEIEEEVLSCSESEHDAIDAALGFQNEFFDFTDFWEVDLKEYTFDYIWCLFAIVWGISVYDKQAESVGLSPLKKSG